MVQRGTEAQTMPAGSLRAGDAVFCSGGGSLAELVSATLACIVYIGTIIKYIGSNCKNAGLYAR